LEGNAFTRATLVTIKTHSPLAVIQTCSLIFATAIILSLTAGFAQTPAPAQPATPQATPTAPTPAQPQPATPSPPKTLPAFYRNLILLDPAHGGTDTGAHLPDNANEKAVTLAFAQRLRPIIAAQGFTVIATRDSDPAADLPADQRAGTANHARPLACILIHATSTGSGIHIASSSLTPLEEPPSPARALSWQTAQAATLPLSLRLANEIGLALANAHLPAVLLRASIPPIDNLICPAVAIELSPSGTPVTDAAYQQHVAEAIATALASFRTHNAPPPAAAPPPPPAPRPTQPAAAPAPATTPSPIPGVPK
jgi:N-acetylmuramoyl-L-alanine amidase